MRIVNLPAIRPRRPAWNKGRIVGQKRPLLPKHVWAIRVRLEIAENVRDLALFNTAIDSKLRGCDLVRLMVADVYAAGQVKERTSILQSKTQKPVRFELTDVQPPLPGPGFECFSRLSRARAGAWRGPRGDEFGCTGGAIRRSRLGLGGSLRTTPRRAPRGGAFR